MEPHHFYLVATGDPIFIVLTLYTFRMCIGAESSHVLDDLFLCIVNKVLHLFCF